MRTRLTWQNVAAPDFSDALQGTRLAGSLFSDAFSNAVNIADDIRTGQKERASSAAITQALGITDPAEFARAVSTGAFGDSRNFTDEALSFFQGQRGSLLDDRATIARTQGQNLLNEAQSFRNQRAPIEAAQDDWKFNFDKDGSIYNRERSRAADASADATAAMQKEISTRVNTLMDTVNMSRDEMAREIARISTAEGWSPEMENHAWKVLEEKNDAQFAVDSFISQDLLSNQELAFGELERGLNSQSQRLDMARSADVGVRLYEDATERFGGLTDPMAKVLEETYGDSTDSEAVKQSRGKARGIYNSLKDDYKHLPPEVIAAALDASKVRGGLLGWSSAEAFSESEARELLDQIKTTEDLNRVINRSNDFSATEDQIEAYESKFNSYLEKAARATERGDSAGAQKYKDSAQELLREFSEVMNPRKAEEVVAAGSGNPAATPQQTPAPARQVPLAPRAFGTQAQMLEEAARVAEENGDNVYKGPGLANDPNGIKSFWDRFLYELGGGSVWGR